MALKISHLLSQSLLVVCVTALVLCVACAPKITIRHQDPTHQRVLLKMDNKEIGALDYGDETELKTSRGVHRVEAIPEGQTSCPWTHDGKGWLIWVDERANLTLLPPPQKKPARPPREIPDTAQAND